MKTHLALLLALLMIGATIPATVAAAVVTHHISPTYTSLYATNYHPPKNVTYYIGGRVLYRYARNYSPQNVPNSWVHIYCRVYKNRTKSWEPWKFWRMCKTNYYGSFSHDVKGVGHAQFKAVFPETVSGSNTLLSSTSNVIDVYMG